MHPNKTAHILVFLKENNLKQRKHGNKEMHQVRQHSSAFGIRRGQEKQGRSQKSMQGMSRRTREKRRFIRFRGICQDRWEPEAFGIQAARSDT